MTQKAHDSFESTKHLAKMLVETSRYLADDAETRNAMGLTPSSDLPADILPRAALICFLELASTVASPSQTAEWLRRAADEFEIGTAKRRHAV